MEEDIEKLSGNSEKDYLKHHISIYFFLYIIVIHINFLIKNLTSLALKLDLQHCDGICLLLLI